LKTLRLIHARFLHMRTEKPCTDKNSQKATLDLKVISNPARTHITFTLQP